MEELTYNDLETRGVDISMIAVCKKIRKLARLDRLTIDYTEHRSGLNKHLFDYIEYCGINISDFIKQYLLNLQPYMLERRKDQEQDKSFICVLDNLYLVSLYIKLNQKQFEEVVVSFHESNKRGVARTNLARFDLQKYVPVFADCILSEAEGKYCVKVLVQRGLKILPISIMGVKCQDVFVVEKRAINEQFVQYCNEYVRELYASDLDLDFGQITVFSALQQISFTSYGKDTFSTFSILIDSWGAQRDPISKAVADFAIVTFAQNLKLTNEQRQELVDLLETKFKVTCIKNIDLLLTRIEDNLGKADVKVIDAF